MSTGIGTLSSLGGATESVSLTAQAPSTYFPITSESIVANRPAIESGSIVGDSMVQAVGDGISTVEGGIALEMDGEVCGQMIWWWNGNDAYTATQLTSSFGYVATAPTVAAVSGGTYPIGAYAIYRYANVLTRAIDGAKLIMPGSAVSTYQTTAGSNLTLAVTVANPSGFPAGFSQAGNILYSASTGARTPKPAAATPVTVVAVGALPACTYANGTAGLGATLTANANGVLTIDSFATVLNSTVLVNGQADPTQNGLYKVTTAGTVSVPFVLTRDTSMDTTAKYIQTFCYIGSGTIYTGTVWISVPTVNPVVGTDPISFTNLAGTETFATYVTGTGTVINDTGAFTNIAATSYYTASLYEHEFEGSAPSVGVDRLKSFTISVNKNNDFAEQYVGCRMDTMKMGVSGMDDKLKMDFSLKGVTAATMTNFTPAFVPLEPWIGWQALTQIDGANDCKLESFEINCSNGVSVIPGMCATPFNRDTISGKRSVNGQLTRQFQDHVYWSKMLAGTEFALKFTQFGQSIKKVGAVAGTKIDTTVAVHGVKATAFQYYMTVTLPRCKISKAGGNISGPDRMIESLGFTAFKDVTEGSDMIIKLYNTTALYS